MIVQQCCPSEKTGVARVPRVVRVARVAVWLVWLEKGGSELNNSTGGN